MGKVKVFLLRFRPLLVLLAAVFVLSLWSGSSFRGALLAMGVAALSVWLAGRFERVRLIWQKVERIWELAWPLGSAVFFMFFFGSDLVLGWMALWGTNGWRFFIYPAIAGTIETLFWYWFFGWAGDAIIQARKARQEIDEFNEEGFPEQLRNDIRRIKRTVIRIWDWLTARIEGEVNSKPGWKQKLANGLLTFIRSSPPALAYTSIFVLPFIPFLGMYIGAGVCRASKLKYDLPVLLLGNMAKIISFTAIVHAIRF